MKYFLLISLFVSLFFTGMVNPDQNVSNYLDADMDYLVDFYKKRHQNPEISLMEKETSKDLASELKKVGYEVTENFGGYGIVGILKNGKGPTILYRTDLDALPMAEKTNLEYASNVWKGTLMLIGQPAEEIGVGAKAMLDAGLYQKFGVPDYGVGLHSSPTIAAGQVGFGKGFTMANTESIDINVFGYGAHGASPHMSIDPVVIASMIVMDLQTIVSRNLKPTESAVVTVGAIQGGVKHNIIPDEVVLKLTVRTYTEEVRLMVHKRIREISRGVAIAAGLPEDKLPVVNIPEEFTPANYNNPELVDKLTASAGKAIGTENVIYAEPQMVGEDFSRYGKTEHQVPTVLYWLGTVPDERMKSGDLPGLHSPFYYPDPRKSIETGVKVTSQGLMDLFNQK
jgi:hippurate hydrolase